MSGTSVISVIIPVYNAASFLGGLLSAVGEFMFAGHDEYEFIFVDDGSVDGSGAALAGAVSGLPRCRLLQLDTNHGKGYAITRGLELCGGQFVCFLDCDLSYPLDYVGRLLESIQSSDCDVVIACRDLEPRNLDSISPLRLVLGKTFNFLSRVVTGLHYRDMQAGLKCFRRDVAEQIFHRITLCRFSFDVEVLYIAHKLNYRVSQVAALVHDGLNKNNTSVNLLVDSVRMFRDLFWIRYCDLSGRYR